MTKVKTHAIENLIEDLNEVENKELQEIMSKPVVLKYIRNAVLAAALQKAMIPSRECLTDQKRMESALEGAYQDGIIDFGNTILSLIPIKE